MARLTSSKVNSVRHRRIQLGGVRALGIGQPYGKGGEPDGLRISLNAGLDDHDPSARNYTLHLTEDEVKYLVEQVNFYRCEKCN